MIFESKNTQNYHPMSKNDLAKYYEKWAAIIKQTDLEIKRACLDQDARFMTNLVELYCGYDYRHMNDYLRFGEDTNSHEYREKSHLLSLIIYLAPRIPCDTVVYRSVCSNFIADLLKNGTAYEKGFMSTTLDFDYACRYHEDHSILKIFVKRNTPCIFTDVIKNREESEVLFPPCAGLQLISSTNKLGTHKKIYECNLFYF